MDMEIEAMSTDDLWNLHVTIEEALLARMEAEKLVLEQRLSLLEAKPSIERRSGPKERRKYPEVHPKFRNPEDPAETWSGRGKQPKWVSRQLGLGHSISEFRI